MAREDLLFYQSGEFRGVLEGLKEGLKQAVDGLDRDYILKVSEEDLCSSLIDRHILEAPVLHDEAKYVNPAQDVQIDVSGRFDYVQIERGGPHYVKGTSITLAIPFEGDEQMFNYRPSAFSFSGIRGRTAGNEVLLEYRGVPQDMTPEKITKDIDNDIRSIKQHLGTIAHDIGVHNEFIKSEVRKLIARRKEKILKEHDLVSELGIPIKRRGDSSVTYAIPTVKRKPRIELPKVQGGAFKPEPVLSESEYEYILKVIHDMALVMERSPSAFVNMKEEDLRTHFLVQLNGHYEGQATGETFNFQGKTDILIRYENKNVFIAECKFWTGERGLAETIDQLLKYVSWRDTKTAVILFNRNKDFSAVLSKIPEVVQIHKCFKRSLGNSGDTCFKYIFHQPDDVNREIHLAVMAFNVPLAS